MDFLAFIPVIGATAAIYVPLRIARGAHIAAAHRDDAAALAAASAVAWEIRPGDDGCDIEMSSHRGVLTQVKVYAHLAVDDAPAVRGWRRRTLPEGERWATGLLDDPRAATAGCWDLWWTADGYRWQARIDALGGWRVDLITRPRGRRTRDVPAWWRRSVGLVWPIRDEPTMSLSAPSGLHRYAYVPAVPLVSRGADRIRA